MNAAIRCDDDQNGTTIQRNIIWRTGGFGEGIISKGDNDILNNIIADLRSTGRQRGYIVFPYGWLKGSVIQHNVLYSCEKGQHVYYEGRSRRGGHVPRLSDTDADYNLYYCSVDPHWAVEALAKHRQAGVEAHSLVADPLFQDISRGDFRFRSASPALKLGIKQPVPRSEVGLEVP